MENIMKDFEIEDGVLIDYTGNETKVIIPDRVTEIEDCAFSDCSSLKEITIPDSVTFIGENAFMGCLSLEEIKVSPDNKYYSSENGVLFNKDKTLLIKYFDGIKNVTDE